MYTYVHTARALKTPIGLGRCYKWSCEPRLHFAQRKRVHCRSPICSFLIRAHCSRALTGGPLDHANTIESQAGGREILCPLRRQLQAQNAKLNARMGRSRKRKFLSGLLIDAFLHSILVSTCTCACAEREANDVARAVTKCPSALPAIASVRLSCCRQSCLVIGLLESSDMRASRNYKPHCGPY